MTKEELLKKSVWEYDLTPGEFYGILMGDQSGPFSQEWALTRVVERLTYYELLSVVNLKMLTRLWSHVRRNVYNDDIRRGIDYVIRKYNLSAAR